MCIDVALFLLLTDDWSLATLVWVKNSSLDLLGERSRRRDGKRECKTRCRGSEPAWESMTPIARMTDCVGTVSTITRGCNPLPGADGGRV